MGTPEELKVETEMVELTPYRVVGLEVSPSKMRNRVLLMMLVVLGVILTTVTLVGVPKMPQLP